MNRARRNIIIMASLLITILIIGIWHHQHPATIEPNADSEISCDDINGEPGAPTFFGDTTLTIVSTNQPNGYQAKLFLTKDLTLLNLSRGDSINQFIDLGRLPPSLCYTSISELLDGDAKPNARGTYKYKIDIPVVDSIVKAVRDIVFMDVDFDKEEELVISHQGYNRYYFSCYKLTDDNPGGFLQPMREPFDQFVVGDSDTFTNFDSKNKTIHIREWLGCSTCVDTWCAFTKDSEYDEPVLHVVRKQEVDSWADGTVITTVWKRVDRELKQVSRTQTKE